MIKSKGYDFLFLSDLDSDTFPCITKRKEKRVDEYSSLNSGDIVIVNEEIENKKLTWKERQLKAINSLSDPAKIRKLAEIVMRRK